MIQLFPQKHFTVVRQIPDHTDSGTYYVKAVIRNAFTDAIIETLELEDKGSQRFKKNWIVCPDPSNEGLYVSIVTSVYTDSGYTTKSSSYGDDENTYLVIARQKGGGGGGSVYAGPSLRDIRDIVKEEISSHKIKFPKFPEIKFPKQEKYQMRWDDVLKRISDVETKISKIPQNKVDLSLIFKELKEMNKNQSEVLSALNKIEITEFDTASVLSKIDDQQDAYQEKYDDAASLMESLPKKISEEMVNTLKKTSFISSSIFSIHDAKKIEKQEGDSVQEKISRDLTKLSL